MTNRDQGSQHEIMDVALRPKILQVVGSLKTGGAETMILNAVEAFRDQCVTHFLVFGDEVGSLEVRATELGTTIHRVPSLRTVDPYRYLRSMINLFQQEGYDAIHSHLNVASWGPLIAARRVGIPHRIVHSHTAKVDRDHPIRRLYSFFALRSIRANANVLLACSNEAGIALFGDSWFSREGKVIPNAINLSPYFTTEYDRHAVRNALGLNEDQQAIGMLSSLTEVKNHEFALDIFSQALELDANRRLLVIGEGPRRAALEQLARSLQIDNQVTFLGLRQDVPLLLRALDLLIMPSLQEGVPVALIEAQAASLPAVISSRVSTDCDLGLGLITRLPLEDPRSWLTRLNAPTLRPGAEQIRSAFTDRGYDVSSSASRLLHLYEAARNANH